MPKSSKQNQSKTVSPPDSLQIASSNATLNTFLGGHTRSWMTGGPAVTTNPRPAPVASSNSRKRNKKRKASDTAPPTHNDNDIERDNVSPVQSSEQPPGARETTIAPTVLPSPALTDAPSPNGSNQVDHINPDSSAHVETVGPGRPVSDSNMRRGDFVHVATNTNQLNHAPTTFAQAESSFPQQAHGAEIATLSAVTNPTTTAQPLQRPDVSFGVDNIQYGSIGPSTSSPRVHPRPSSIDSEHRAKRPRVQRGSTSELIPDHEVCRYWLQVIQSREEQLHNDGPFNNNHNVNNHNVEGPRYAILKDACQNEDFIFIAFHQALCAWTLNKEPIHVAFNGLVVPGTLDRAFETMQTIVRRNELMPVPHLQWFANFPTPISDFSRAFPGSAAARELSVFLIRMATHWHPLLRNIQTRSYPLIAYEVIHILQCRFHGLQTMLFTMSRRMLNVNDGLLANALSEIFRQDLCDEKTFETRGEHPEVMRIHREAVVMKYKRVISLRPSVSSNTTVSPVAGQNPPIMERNRQQPVARPPLATNVSPHTIDAAASPVPLPNFDAVAARASIGGPGATNPMPISQAFSQGSRGLQGARRPNHLHIQTETPAVPPFTAHTSQSPLAQPPTLPRSSSAGSPVMLQQNRALQSNGQVRTPVMPSNSLLPQRRANSFAFPPPAFPSPGPPGAQNTNTHNPSVHPHSPGFQQARGPTQMTSPHHTQTVQSPQHPPVYPATSPPRRVSVSQNLNYAVQATNPPTVPYQVPVIVNSSHQMLPVQQIPPAEYPPSPHVDSSLQIGLHQIEVRSPRRVPSHKEKGRFYQFVKQLVYEPVHLEPARSLRRLPFTVPEDYMRQLSRKIEGTGLPFCYYSEGSYRCRLRMCMLPEAQPDPKEHDWVVTATSWPSYIFFDLNNKQLELRRKQHFGKDQPVELTDFLVKGENQLRISYPPVSQNNTPGFKYCIAIEIVETISYSAVCNMIKSIRRWSPDQTMARIKRRLQPSDSDDIIIEDETLTISLTDPFSATRFKDPVRGIQCKHLECFDLDTWLNTRPPKPEQFGGGPEEKGDEPSMVDVWRCPICSLDARPNSLWIDEYFAGVRRSLIGIGDLRTKSISVTANGRWAPVLIADDTDDETTPAPQPRNTVNGNAGKEPRPSVTTAPTVIEILDDDDD